MGYIDNTNRFGTIVNNGRIYDFLPCKDTFVPDEFIFVTDEELSPSIAFGQLILEGCGRYSECKPLSIPFAGIVPETIFTMTCQDAVAQVVDFDCFEQDCASNIRTTINIVRDISYCEQTEFDWTVAKNWDCGCDEEATCDQKMTAFAALINATSGLNDLVTASTTGSAPNLKLRLTAKVAGEGFSVPAIEGLDNATIVTPNQVKSFYGKDFEEWDAACVPGLCEADVCYTVVMFKYFDLIPGDEDLYGGSSMSRDQNNAYKYILKQAAIVIDEEANETYLEDLNTILMGGAEPIQDYFNKIAYVAPIEVGP